MTLRLPGRILGSGLLATALVALLAVAACSPQPQVPVAAVTPTSILAESATTCFGFTARLALASMQDGIDSTSSHVRGVSWVLEIDGAVDVSTANEVVASVDSFAIRGDQGNRLDLAIIKLPGFGRRFSASGLVRIPELPGGVQEGDQTRILAWIQTP